MAKKPVADLHIRVNVIEMAGSRLADQTQQRGESESQLPSISGVFPYIVRSRNPHSGVKKELCRMATRQLSANRAQDSCNYPEHGTCQEAAPDDDAQHGKRERDQSADYATSH